MQVASEAAWTFGSKRLIRQPKNVGLVGQWIACNAEPAEHSAGAGAVDGPAPPSIGHRGVVVIFEDDMQVLFDRRTPLARFFYRSDSPPFDRPVTTPFVVVLEDDVPLGRF